MKKNRQINRHGSQVLKAPLLMVNILFFTLISNSELHADEYPAELVWMNRVDLSMFVSGIIKEVFVKPGDLVVKGKQLVKLDTRIKQAQLEESVAILELQNRLRDEAKRELDVSSVSLLKSPAWVVSLLIDSLNQCICYIQLEQITLFSYYPHNG